MLPISECSARFSEEKCSAIISKCFGCTPKGPGLRQRDRDESGRIDNRNVAEAADLLLRDDMTDWVMAYGFSQDKLVISLRTEQEQLHADKVMHKLVARKGTGGGHPSYAGGQIGTKGLSQRQIAKLEALVVGRFVKAVVKDGTKTKTERLIRQ